MESRPNPRADRPSVPSQALPGHLPTLGAATAPVHRHAVELAFASSNPHKVREIKTILAGLGISVVGLDELARAIPPPVEDAATFEQNARLKAVAYARALGRVCLADDSGLEVDALGGAPGVQSAIYAGAEGSREDRDRANREKLMRKLRNIGAMRPRARLVCTLCLADAEGRILFETRGTAEAIVADEPRGGSGFGYDSLLVLQDSGKTIAEMPADEWNARSHRGQATRALHRWLAARGLDGRPA